MCFLLFDDMNACMFDLFDVVIGVHRDADNKRFFLQCTLNLTESSLRLPL